MTHDDDLMTLDDGTLAFPDEDLQPCLACGQLFDETDIELTQGWCPHCHAQWVPTSERTP